MKSDLITDAGLSRNRFEKLRNNLRIVDVNNPNPNDRLWKVRPLLDQFAARCHELQKEARLCIDQQIVPFKGRLDIKQYVKGKPHPRGVNIFILYGESGLVYDFLPYQGSTTNLEDHFKQRERLGSLHGTIPRSGLLTSNPHLRVRFRRPGTRHRDEERLGSSPCTRPQIGLLPSAQLWAVHLFLPRADASTFPRWSSLYQRVFHLKNSKSLTTLRTSTSTS
ncbi:hypothetical protein HPB49_009021 [Dermacentor silvarum]|uniref:Uncharacterized protein n=1 Tax=Dermacentor silvarum TaxID=543639 RepID=A0ACB8C8L2_DERSI|nr:hypothetical protein HPB49_009021 [Dermacentor silvarum]